MDYRENLSRLFALQKFGVKLGLESMTNLLNKLGNPHHGGLYIHIAGTNGKGSVSSMLASILKKSGYKVGMYTSPHLVTFRERVQINGEMISEDDVLKYSDKIWNVCDSNIPPTFFEFVTALAFMHFKEQNVDISIIETGMGGRLDATNVIDPLITAITNVSLDHMDYLGPNVSCIAKEKAGIMKRNRLFIGGCMSDEAIKVIKEVATYLDAKCKFYGKDYYPSLLGCDNNRHPIFDYNGINCLIKNLSCGLDGRHQIENASLALAVIENLKASGFKITEEYIRTGLAEVKWPGRGEVFQIGSWPPEGVKAQVPLILDGAHNPEGARVLASTLSNIPTKRLHLVLGVMADKDVAGILEPIIKMADQLYLTRPTFERAASPELLLSRLEEAFGHLRIPVALYQTLPQAIRALSQNVKMGDLAVISGSLFTVGEARAYLLGIPEVESN